MNRTRTFDVIVIGSGFSGSLMAMIARRLGKSVLMIERAQHPRFAIGESTTPLTNLFLEEIARKYQLDFLLDLSSWGRWQLRYPELPCGIKRGFSFFHHEIGKPFRRQREHGNELLVAASPNDSLADTHWFRESFDAFLVSRARAIGVIYEDQTEMIALREKDSFVEIVLDNQKHLCCIRAKFVIDASGPRGAIHKLLRLPECRLEAMPLTRSFFGHFHKVRRCEEMADFASTQIPPYPIDAAAVHHLFGSGWFWNLHFNNAITSAGIVARSDWRGWHDNADEWTGVLQSFPSLREMFEAAEPIGKLRAIDKVPFCASRIHSKRWALLPSAVASIDPLFSTGFPLTLLGILRIANIVNEAWETPSFVEKLSTYAQLTRSETQRIGRLIGLAYDALGHPHLFNTITYLYFASVSFEETSRRLGRASLDCEFLSGGQNWILDRLDHCLKNASQCLQSDCQNHKQEVVAQILRAIEPFNLIGLGQSQRRNWYPALPQDIFSNRKKLRASSAELRRMFLRAGFSPKSISSNVVNSNEAN